MKKHEKSKHKKLRVCIYDVQDYERDYFKKELKEFTTELKEEGLNNYLASSKQDYDIVSTFMNSRINADILSHFPNLKMIATRSTGYDHIDVGECKRRGIAVCNVPRYGENTVAEHTFALILAVSRKIVECSQRTKAGNFSRQGLAGFDLAGKTLGVIGTGKIGKHVIRIAKGFEMNVIAHDMFPDQKAAKDLVYKYCGLPEILQRADIITLHAPLTKETVHMIGRKEIAVIKKGAVIINTSRGALIDTKALIKGLLDSTIAAAGLDVLEEEDFVKEEAQLIFGNNHKSKEKTKMKIALENHILLTMPNVIITPHNAFNSTEALQRIMQTTAENIISFSNGKVTNEVQL